MDLRTAFGSFDANGDGQITKQEFRNILTRNNSSLTVTDADSIFDSLDVNKDGVLTIDEFARGLGRGALPKSNSAANQRYADATRRAGARNMPYSAPFHSW